MLTIRKYSYLIKHSSVYDPDASDFQNNTNITNYRYDHIGNLVTDLGDSIKQITWTVSGKIKSITRDSLCTTKPDLSFDYDATDNRIAKHVYLKNDDKTINTAQSSHTYYIRDAQGNIMATYNHIGTNTLDLQEQPIYGSNRIGEYKPQGDSTGIVRGTRMYEETNHLGNVLVVFSDCKIPSFLNNDTTYRVHIADANDYYPFGMEMYGRGLLLKNKEDKYRFGFGGMEKDVEVSRTGSTYDFGGDSYDSRIGRRKGLDSEWKKGTGISPYSTFFNNPILHNDTKGRWPISTHYNMTFDALIKVGYSKEISDKVAHYSATLADHPKGGPKFAANLWAVATFTNPGKLSYRDDKSIDYNKYEYSQSDDPNKNGFVIHAMRGKNEGITEQEAMDRTYKMAMGIMDKYAGEDLSGLSNEALQEIGVAFHMLQDIDAHKGKIWDIKQKAEKDYKNEHNVLTMDLLGDTKESEKLTNETATTFSQDRIVPSDNNGQPDKSTEIKL